MIKIDMMQSPRKNQFKWFNSFANPCYGIDSRIDVTNVVEHAKFNQRSFFVDFLYVVTEALHSVEEMRLRILGEDVVLYDVINPRYTIMTDTGSFENCRHSMTHDYLEFYSRAAENIELTKHNKLQNKSFNDVSVVDDFYITSVPWIDFLSMTNPIPDKSKESASIPRVGWGKFVPNNDKFELTVNITVNHALVDGKPLCDTFLNLQKIIENISPKKMQLCGWSEL